MHPAQFSDFFSAVWQSIVAHDLIQILDSALTPTLAVITCYIAYQQWRTNKTRIDLDLYDRRLAVFKAIEEFYDETFIDGSVSHPKVGKLRSATAEARFLFSRDIERHLDILYAKAHQAASLHNRLYPAGQSGLPVGDDRNKTVDEFGNLLAVIQDNFRPQTRKLFRKYLKIG